jgi:hypothetical protein
MSFAQALLWSERLAGWALLLQMLELLWLRGWIQRTWTRGPALLPFLLAGVAAALGLMLAPGWIFLVLALTALAGIAARLRGPFNGGADSMTWLVLVCLLVAELAPADLGRIGFLYLGAQTCLSYFVAGCVKLRHAGWREGRELGALLRQSAYEVPAWARGLADHTTIVRVGTWSLLVFELLFPLALFRPELMSAFLGVGLAFHWANFAVLGLNRFFWIWLAAYPALLFAANSIAASS